MDKLRPRRVNIIIWSLDLKFSLSISFKFICVIAKWNNFGKITRNWKVFTLWRCKWRRRTTSSVPIITVDYMIIIYGNYVESDARFRMRTVLYGLSKHCGQSWTRVRIQVYKHWPNILWLTTSKRCCCFRGRL